MKIGLLFGSFNPIHVGHLIVANTMAETTDLDKVWLVVSPQNPFKKQKDLLHEFDRLDMAEKAIFDNAKLSVSDVEFAMSRPSYTIDTLRVLQEKYPQHSFVLIMGEDNLADFPKWKSYQDILDNYGLYVYPRPHSKPSELKQHPQVRMVEAPLLDISATFIRKCVRAGASVRYLLPDEVERYIKEKKFYL
jgi:nicotinate-nucleotide adenylyltransferase